MKPKIVFLDRYTLNGAPLKGIEQIGQFTSYDNTSADELMERAGDAEIIITNKVPFDRARLAALPKLRLICVAATGLNTIDLDAAAQLGIEVRNAVGYSTESVTEATISTSTARHAASTAAGGESSDSEQSGTALPASPRSSDAKSSTPPPRVSNARNHTSDCHSNSSSQPPTSFRYTAPSTRIPAA